MLINNRDESRRIFYQAWQKYSQSIPMEPMESLICSIIQLHPEYHDMLKNTNLPGKAQESSQEHTNAFLHMGLHIALQEQLGTDRPMGIASIYRLMLGKCTDEHLLQHRFMACLEEMLWQAQRDGHLPDEQEYLDRVRRMTL